jgi:predicted GNAT family N-acyltransferase
MEQPGIEIRVVDTYSALDRLALSESESDPAQTGGFGLDWQPKTHHVLVLKDGAPVAHTGLVLNTITIEDRSLQVAGIGGVLTRPCCRGQGLGRMGMQAAEDFVRQRQLAQFGMLFCREEMRAWYERLGWSQVTSLVWMDQPAGVRQSPMPVMVKSFGAENWPPGTVRLGCFPW